MQNNQDRAGGSKRGQSTARKVIARFARCEKGATSIEYGLICSLIFLAIVASVNGVASATQVLHNKISTQLN